MKDGLEGEKRYECVMVEGTLYLSIYLFTYSMTLLQFSVDLQYLKESINTVLKLP